MLVSVLWAAGCEREPGVVRSQAATQFHCDEAHVQVDEDLDSADGPIYEVDACGHEARYRCAQSMIDERGRDLQPVPNVVTTCHDLANATSATP